MGRNMSDVAVMRGSGWSIPREQGIEERYAAAIDGLYRYYGPANDELYRLMDELDIGFRGRFPTTADEAAAKAAQDKELRN